MDPANVVMVVFKLLSSAFIEYDVSKNEVVSVSLDGLNQILRRVKPTDTLTLELDETKNRLKIRLTGDTDRMFNLSLINIEDREQKVPELEFPISVETSSKILEDAINDVGIVAESVSFSIKDGKFLIKSEGHTSDAKVDIPGDDDTVITAESDAESKYSVEYLNKIIKGGKLVDKVILKFNKDYPLHVDYNLLNKLGLSFILAPRVSND